jgi:hypothetical protein
VFWVNLKLNVFKSLDDLDWVAFEVVLPILRIEEVRELLLVDEIDDLLEHDILRLLEDFQVNWALNADQRLSSGENRCSCKY